MYYSIVGKMAKKFFVGTSGYDYEHWKGRFYPDDLPETAWFNHYADAFDTVEINYSFYQWPKKETLENWREQAPTGFKYSIKAPRTFTHVRRLKNVSGKISDLYELTDLFGRKKGCPLFQLPPSFTLNDTNLTRLQTFVEALDGRRDSAIEFRDASWWVKEVYELLDENHVGFCTVSGFDMPRDLVQTGRIAYLRFHGEHYDTSYSESQLKAWANRIKNLSCSKVYAYFNNDANAFAVKNAKKLREALP
jgi:uncharacterized protein YecE (DUF72 family)